MTFPITSLYAVPIAVLLIGFSVTVSTLRGRFKVALGDGGQPRLNEWMRRHANLAENAPIVLLLLALAEAAGAGAVWLHGTGLIFLASRLIHPFGIDAARPGHPLRIVGGVGTSIATMIPAVCLAFILLRQG
ncbi:MAG: MAPEG family protein [Paracoccaceae bacterium]